MSTDYAIRDSLWYRLKIYKNAQEQIESDSLTTLTRVESKDC